VRHVQLQSTNEASLCTYIQSVFCHIRSSVVTSEVRDLNYIFLNVSNLRTLVFDGASMAPNVLQIAFHTASATLESLELTVDDDILLDAQHIGRLQRLQSLNMTSRADWSKAYLTWNLPCLTRLDWQGSMDGPSKLRCSGDIGFLKQCRFPILRRLFLKLTRGEEPSESEVTICTSSWLLCPHRSSKSGSSSNHGNLKSYCRPSGHSTLASSNHLSHLPLWRACTYPLEYSVYTSPKPILTVSGNF
jgi:hypothetical protein